jgi:ABC-2 type transport system ATP-binding protein
MAAIEIQGLSKRFGDLIAVDDLSFVAREGAVTGFLGPNGAGKTTTLRMLLGLATPTAGSATINGQPYRQLHEPFRHVGAVLESTGFHPGRRARDHLRVLATAARLVKSFSLGMRQRLGLASALLGEPEVLILDEPANGLDPEGVHWLRRFLRGFADQGGTVLVSSHLLAEVAHTVDEVVIITRGRLVSQALLADLTHRSQAGVRVRTPRAETLRGALAAEGIAAELVTADALVAFQTTTEAVGLAAAGANVAIYEMTAQGFDLEELFLELTNSEEAVR